MTRLTRILVSATAVVAVVTACSGPTGPSPASSASAAGSSGAGSAAPSGGASVAPSSVSGSSPASAPAGTTLIDWGLIWEDLPSDFPVYPGSHPTVTGGGPASAILDVPATPTVASTWYQATLRTAGFAITGANGPREDGSFDVTGMRSGSDCQVEVSLAPLGTTTTATIYLGAACPFK